MTKDRGQPNLLFIYADQMAVSALGAYGNDIVETPNLDRLAGEGTVFERAYITQPICTPSRSTLLTGLYPHTSGCIKNNIPLPDDTECFPEIGDFGDYRTAHFGKWHLGDEVFPQHGFKQWRTIEDQYRQYYSEGRDRFKNCDYYHFLRESGFKPDRRHDDGFTSFSRGFCAHLPERYSKPAYLSREATRFIRDNREDPFLLYVNFLEPHTPFFSCRDDQYEPEDVVLPPNFNDKNSKRLPSHIHRRQEETAREGQNGLDLSTETGWRRLIANYWGLVSLVDTHVGRILDCLEECGLQEETIVVFTSDHGDMMGSHRLITKNVMYEEALRVPLFLRIPGLNAPGEVAEPISHIDLVPTLLDAMNQIIPGHLEGKSWMPFLEDGGGSDVSDVVIQHHGESCGRPRTIITPSGWKFSYRQNGEHELFNLHEDPFELNNIYGGKDYEKLVGSLTGRIQKWQEQYDEHHVEISSCK